MAEASAADVMTMAAAATPTLTLTAATAATSMPPTPTQPHTPTTPRQMASMYLLDLYASNTTVNIIAPTDEPNPNVSVELVPCSICSRTFNPATLQKHVGICEKMATKKRNVFDSSRQRREGTELATYPLPKNYGLSSIGGSTAASSRGERGQSPKPQQIASPILTRKKSQDEFSRSTARTSMRKRSNSTNGGARTPTSSTAAANASAFNAAINTASSGGGGSFTRDRMRSSDRALGKRMQQPVAEQCPHCDRCFGMKAYDRHVEWCKEKALQAAIKQNTKNEQNVAKERLEARTKYRAPCLKTKRSINREKYSGFAGDENDTTDSPKSINNMMSLSMTSSITSDRNATIAGNVNGASCKMKNREERAAAVDVGTEPPPPPTQDFHIMGETVATYGKKKQQQRREEVHKITQGNVIKRSSSRTRLESSALTTLAQKLTAAGAGADPEEAGDSGDARDATRANTDGDINLSTALTLRQCQSATSLGAPMQMDTLKSSSTSITRRKLKTKQKSAVNLTQTISEPQPKQQQHQQSVQLKSSSSVDELSTIMPDIVTGKPAIFDITKTTTAATAKAAAAAATNATAAPAPLHTKLEANPIKPATKCRPNRKKLVRQPSTTTYATPLKAIPLLKENIEIFGRPDMSTLTPAVDDKQITVIKAPPAVFKPPLSPPLLVRNRSFTMRSRNETATWASKEPLYTPSTSKYDVIKSSSDHYYHDAPEGDATDAGHKKREIFISIETEQNELGQSPISPDSLRHMVGNSQVEVEIDANDNKFSRISDDEPLPPTPSQLNMGHGAPYANLQHLPNVHLNNAKNLIQKMQKDFRQMSEEVGANMRHAVQTTAHKGSATGSSHSSAAMHSTASGDAGVDSDDMSSLDGYPISSQSSRRGVSSKLSADSAYGSLSRQRSSDTSQHRSLSRTRPATASAATNTSAHIHMVEPGSQHQQPAQLSQQLPQQTQQQPHYKYANPKSRARQFSGSSSSGSDNSLPPIASHNINLTNCNSNYQQQLSQLYNNNSNSSNTHNNSNNNCESPMSSPTGTAATGAMTTNHAQLNDSNANLSHASSNSNSTSTMSTSLKLSKFCHECGSKFIIEHAKFCTDCGVRRIVLT